MAVQDRPAEQMALHWNKQGKERGKGKEKEKKIT